MPDMKRKGEDEEMSLEGCYKMIKSLAEKLDSLMDKGADEDEKGKKEDSEETAKEGDGKDEEGAYKKFVNKAEVTEDKDYDEQESEKVEDEDEPSSLKEEKKSQDEDKPGDMSKPKDKKGMDAQITAKSIFREISRRDALAQRLSSHIGAFDHSNKTFAEVAQYGLKQLGLRCSAGQEAAMLEGFLSAARRNTVVATAKDSNIKSSCVDAYLNGGE